MFLPSPRLCCCCCFHVLAAKAVINHPLRTAMHICYVQFDFMFKRRNELKHLNVFLFSFGVRSTLLVWKRTFAIERSGDGVEETEDMASKLRNRADSIAVHSLSFTLIN